MTLYIIKSCFHQMRLPDFRIEVLEQIMGVGSHIDIVFVGFDSYHMSVNNGKWFLLHRTSIRDQ